MADPQQEWIFTFGAGHNHPATGQDLDGHYVRIVGSSMTARRAMVRHFGRHWAGQYRSPQGAGVTQYGLVELPRDQWPKVDLFEGTLHMRAPAPWVNSNDQRSATRQERIDQTGWIRLWRDAGHKIGRTVGWPALDDVEIEAMVRFPDDGVTRDSPNTYESVKAVIDGALVDTGVLPDDNDQYVAMLCIRRGPRIPVRPYQPAGELHLTIREYRGDC